ncbi:putative salicylate hydroxylase protein [Lasiodiplodia theobromae]|nr:putative salicylate hydroxylase protein [Lasiodiplodia theobromae]
MDANKELRVAIVGSGMGGLTCALALARKGFKHIAVYEIATNLGFVGAGIQLAPNMARILDRLGVWKDIEAEAVDLKETSIRQGSTDGELAHVDLNYIRDTYGYPHMVGHRASLAGSLYEGCKREKAITFHFGTVVKEVLSWGPKPRLAAQKRSKDGEGEGETFEIEADLVLAADGVKSVIRDQMLRELRIDASIVDTGQAAYRIMLTRDEMKHDPELLALIDKSAVTRWIGEKRHIIAYPVSSKNIYNLSTVQPDKNFADAPSITYTTKGSKAEMLRVFGDFCPMIVRMLDLVPEGEVCEWKLRVHAPIPTWVHGSVALVGDACHPTLPHLAQGAAQAIEDAAVLGEVLARMPAQDPDTINRTLQVYQQLRKERAETLVELAAASGRALHLGEGAAKEERDKQFAALKEKKGGAVPDKWADADVQKKIYGHDCMEVAAEEYEGLLRGVVAQNGVAAAA